MSFYLDSKFKAPLSIHRMHNSLNSGPLVKVLISWIISCPQSGFEFKRLFIVIMCRFSLVHSSSNVLEKAINRNRNSTRAMQ